MRLSEREEIEIYKESLSRINKSYLLRSSYHSLDPIDFVHDVYLKVKTYFNKHNIDPTYDYFKGVMFKALKTNKLKAVDTSYFRSTDYKRMVRDSDEIGAFDKIEGSNGDHYDPILRGVMDELPILKLKTQGYTVKEIGQKVNLHERNVQRHINAETAYFESVYLAKPIDKRYVLTSNVFTVVSVYDDETHTFESAQEASDFIRCSKSALLKAVKANRPVKGFIVKSKPVSKLKPS